jgi:hypothetical protein
MGVRARPAAKGTVESSFLSEGGTVNPISGQFAELSEKDFRLTY